MRTRHPVAVYAAAQAAGLSHLAIARKFGVKKGTVSAALWRAGYRTAPEETKRRLRAYHAARSGFTAADLPDARALRREGRTLAAIARLYGVSETTIRRWLPRIDRTIADAARAFVAAGRALADAGPRPPRALLDRYRAAQGALVAAVEGEP